ncbi:LysR substrate-binding domain-containing protein [Oceanisphaera sp. KMM 10153]|uniref:LysR substrate-binding domain-containing protein n=1 Tax=Oceanisphaera submarina TaxID=3390193 RepID=UPI00397636AA
MTPEEFERNMVSRLKIKYLKLLVTVSEQGNIVRAAQIMNMAQPAVTKIIRDIETALDLVLFERSSRGVSLTLYGEVLIKHAKLMLSQVKHASEELSTLQGGLAGHVTIGTLITASLTLLPKTLVRLREQRPSLSVTVVEGTNDRLLPALIRGELDLVVGRMPERQEYDGLSSEVLYHEPVVIVARGGHPLGKQAEMELKDLAGEAWILPSPQTYLRKEVEQAFRDQGLARPAQVLESVSVLTNLTLLAETDMIAAMPYQVFRNYEKNGGLCRLAVGEFTRPGPVGITTRNGSHTPAAAYVMSLLREVAEELHTGTEE